MARCYFKIDCRRKNCKEASVCSIGHAKNRLTVQLSAKGDCTKLKSCVLLPKKRPVPKLVKKFGSKAVLVFQGTNWIKAFTEDYVNSVIGGQCLIHIDYLCGAASSVILARTQKILLKG